MNRRDVLRVGTSVVLAAPFATAAAQWRVAGPATAVIFDGRFPQSARYAGIVGGPGCAAFGVGEDIMATCRDVLAPWLQSRSGSGLRLAGLTQYSDFLVLRDVAREVGLRASRFVQHDGVRRSQAGDRTVSLTAWTFERG